MTRIQLIGNVSGYLDISTNLVVPINIKAADIRDITKRSGSFSKTITLPGTKNNNNLLNDYFEVNVLDGTFNINKVQKCILLENNVPILENTYLQLVSVKKIQNTLSEDQLVQYEIVIKDNIADFFTKINNKELTDIELSTFDHIITAANIESTFNNTWSDGYKYLLPWSDDNIYNLNECKPAIYAKQYWDRIHSAAGYEYDWSTLSALNVQFDKLLIPFNGDEKKLNEELAELNKIVAEETTQQEDETVGTPIINGTNKYSKTEEFSKFAVISTELMDPNSNYNPVTSKYTSPFNVSPPGSIDFIYDIDYDIIIENNGTEPVRVAGAGFGEYVVNLSTSSSNTILPTIVTTVALNSPLNIVGVSYPVGTTVIFSNNTNTVISTSPINAGSIVSTFFSLDDINGASLWQSTVPFSTLQPQVTIKVRINYIKLTIKLNTEIVLFNTDVPLNAYIPKKVKQSDFIKSIMIMYNLFVETDVDNPNKLIYKHRDSFYDSGTVVDWTSKLARDKDQDLKFLPEINAKKMLFTYKEDSDDPNKVYTSATNEIYGQQEVVFQNNYVKGVDRKEIVFSPTPSMPTIFGAILPLLSGGAPKTNIRILLDNGELPCQSYKIINYVGNERVIDSYPFISHLNKEYNPTFDINFGVCDFYFYNILNYTQNNLYNNFWRRTMSQLDSGKLLIAYFNLNETDISKLRLNDKIRIDNSYWNINAIVDYNANGNSLTKVELISVDEDLKLPTFGKSSIFLGNGLVPITDNVVLPTNVTKSIQSALQSLVREKNLRSSVSNSNKDHINLGRNNIISAGFTGVIIGDNIRTTQSGVYIGDILINNDGEIISTTGIFLDGGLDTVIDLNRTNIVDIVSGSEDAVRTNGDIKKRTFIDGNPVNY